VVTPILSLWAQAVHRFAAPKISCGQSSFAMAAWKGSSSPSGPLKKVLRIHWAVMQPLMIWTVKPSQPSLHL